MKKGRKADAGRADPGDSARDVLRITTGSLRVPAALKADEEESRKRIDAVVVVIVSIALGFIALVAWLIYRAP
jgi:hypothetical protein